MDLAAQMNCFEVQSRTSDILDGIAQGPLKKETENHIDACRDCAGRIRHFRQILQAISASPKNHLPIPIRKDPGHAPITKSRQFSLMLEKISHMPWFMKTSIQGLFIVGLVLSAIKWAPRGYRYFMIRWEDSQNESTEDLDPLIPPSYRRNLAPVAVQHEAESDFSGGDGADSEEAVEENPKKASAAGRAEIWRFQYKTDSPKELHARVIAELKTLKIPLEKLGPLAMGVDVPGGVQFNLLADRSIVSDLKTRLENLVPASERDDTGKNPTAGFNWYRLKSKKPIPEGQTRIVIWISQM